MIGINIVQLIGRLGKDPEVRHLESGKTVASLSVATSESYKNQRGERVDETEWHSVTIWGKQAEVAEKYLSKGDMVYIMGKLKTRSYEKEGSTRYITEIQGKQMQMLSPKGQTADVADDGDNLPWER